MLAAVRPPGYKPRVEVARGRCLTGRNIGNLLTPFGGNSWPQGAGGKRDIDVSQDLKVVTFRAAHPQCRGARVPV